MQILQRTAIATAAAFLIAVTIVISWSLLDPQEAWADCGWGGAHALRVRLSRHRPRKQTRRSCRFTPPIGTDREDYEATSV